MAPSKRLRNDQKGPPPQDDDANKDALIESLRSEIHALKNANSDYYASDDAVHPDLLHNCIPTNGMPARHIKERITQHRELDNRPRLNTSSYVNVVQEPEEQEIALAGLSTNLADASVYPASVRLHDTVVNMIAQLWNCPSPTVADNSTTTSSGAGGANNYSGAGTVGSTEACLLAGIALKFRWRKWYQAKHGLTTTAQMFGVVPNIIISSCYQAAWEKFFRYFDVAPRFVKPTLANRMRMDPQEIAALCDEQTIAVVGILGNHYNGAYDPIWEINNVVEQVNAEKGYQIGIHVDAASGGFIAPFQEGMPPFDFRLKNVLSISASGHKFGESCCGTGWLVFRQRQDLAEHIAVSVSYLGGKSDSMTLNFSRPATAAYVQYYKFLRLGLAGYQKKVAQQMQVAKFLRDHLRSLTYKGKPRFEIVDAGDEYCLPVVAARLNTDSFFKYNDVDLQHAVAEFHWYVSAYSLSFENVAEDDKLDMLCSDIDHKACMFRIVVKANLTQYLAQDLVTEFDKALELLDHMRGDRFESLKRMASLMRGGHDVKTKGHSAC